jgi:predicted nicotinamide N-methyase
LISQAEPLDPRAFIERNLRLAEVPGFPGLRLYTAHAGSGLWQVKAAPYWAFPWAGGLTLAKHIAMHPETVRDRRVLDLGAGCGLVAIAAAKAGASAVLAADIDAFATAAIELNARANGVSLTIIGDDLLPGEPPPVHLILVGDLFYTEKLSARLTRFLERCRAASIDVLVGDPRRSPLPLDRLHHLAEYEVPDFGGGSGREGGVYAFR